MLFTMSRLLMSNNCELNSLFTLIGGVPVEHAAVRPILLRTLICYPMIRQAILIMIIVQS